MSKYAIDLKEEIETLKFVHKINQRIDCNSKENKIYSKMVKDKQELPPDIHQYPTNSDLFYKVYKSNLNPEELDEYLKLKKLEYIKKIKSCCVFFVILTIISMIVTFLLFGNI